MEYREVRFPSEELSILNSNRIVKLIREVTCVLLLLQEIKDVDSHMPKDSCLKMEKCAKCLFSNANEYLGI